MTEAERPPSLNADGTFTLNTGARIPAVGLGTWLANEGESRAAVAAALKTGYRCLDCAHLYGTEAEVGGALKEALENGTVKREDVFVTSKLWCTTSAKHRAAQVRKYPFNPWCSVLWISSSVLGVAMHSLQPNDRGRCMTTSAFCLALGCWHWLFSVPNWSHCTSSTGCFFLAAFRHCAFPH